MRILTASAALFLTSSVVSLNAQRILITDEDDRPAPHKMEGVSAQRVAHSKGSRGSQKGKGHNKSQTKAHQGQATSSAYAGNSDHAIEIDVSLAEEIEASLAQADHSVDQGTSPNEGAKSATRHTTVAASGPQALSKAALQNARAQHEIKRKLQEQGKKKFKLQDVASSSSQKDPREDLLRDLMDASEEADIH